MDAQSRVISWEDLAKHSIRSSLWVLISGNVYDVTTYLAEHPGGDDILVRHGGKDATEYFNKMNHSEYAKSLRDARLVGAITQDPQPQNYKDMITNVKSAVNNFFLNLTFKSIDKNKLYNWDEVLLHNKKNDLWIVIENKIYDVTEFQDEHPGGPAVLLARGGDDATNGFNENRHSQRAVKMLETYQVGIVQGQRPAQASSSFQITNIIIGLLLLVLVAGGVMYFKQ